MRNEKSRSREKTRSPPRTGGHSVGAYCGLFAPSRITRSARRKRDKEDEEEVTEEGMVSMAGERAKMRRLRSPSNAAGEANGFRRVPGRRGCD